MRKTIKNFMFIKRKETAMMMIAVAIAIIGAWWYLISLCQWEMVKLCSWEW